MTFFPRLLSRWGLQDPIKRGNATHPRCRNLLSIEIPPDGLNFGARFEPQGLNFWRTSHVVQVAKRPDSAHR